MIVHGPSTPEATLSDSVPCCGLNLDLLEPGCLITVDPAAVTCEGRPAFHLFTETFDVVIFDLGIVAGDAEPS